MRIELQNQSNGVIENRWGLRRYDAQRIPTVVAPRTRSERTNWYSAKRQAIVQNNYGPITVSSRRVPSLRDFDVVSFRRMRNHPLSGASRTANRRSHGCRCGRDGWPLVLARHSGYHRFCLRFQQRGHLFARGKRRKQAGAIREDHRRTHGQCRHRAGSRAANGVTHSSRRSLGDSA